MTKFEWSTITTLEDGPVKDVKGEKAEIEEER